MAETFRCTVVTPEREVLDQQVTYASIPAFDGQLGVAHLRAPLVAKLGYGPLRLDSGADGQKVIYLSGGFARVKNDTLVILTDEALEPEAINASRVEKMIQQLASETAVGDQAMAKKQERLDRLQGMLATLR